MRLGIQLPGFSYGGDRADVGPTFGQIAREADEATSPPSRAGTSPSDR